MDVIYVYRSCDTIALRYSLRSLKNVPHDRVFLVGDKPDWIREIIHLPVKDLHEAGPYKLRILNVWHKLTEACKSEISDNFIFFNDDFFVLKEMKDFPYYYRGSIPRPQRPSGHQSTVLKAAQYFDSPLDFCTHTPLVYNKKKFLSLYDHYDITKGLNHRVLYCNHFKVQPLEKIADVKVRNMSKMRNPRSMFLSTHNKIERKHIFKEEMDKLFPEKSKYESDVL